MVLNGTIGARLHIGFPVLNRSSFGFWLSYFSVVSRVVLAMFWFGVQVRISLGVMISEALNHILVVHRFRVRVSDVKGNLAIYREHSQPLAAIWSYHHRRSVIPLCP